MKWQISKVINSKFVNSKIVNSKIVNNKIVNGKIVNSKKGEDTFACTCRQKAPLPVKFWFSV